MWRAGIKRILVWLGENQGSSHFLNQRAAFSFELPLRQETISTDPPPPKDQSKYLSKLDGKRVLVLGGTSGIWLLHRRSGRRAQRATSSCPARRRRRSIKGAGSAPKRRTPSRAGPHPREKRPTSGTPATLEAELKGPV